MVLSIENFNINTHYDVKDNQIYHNNPIFKISYCITCHNRTWQLKQTLAHNILGLQEDEQIVLVNYSSNDGLDEFIKTNHIKSIVDNKLKYIYVCDQNYYNCSIAKNIAHYFADSDYVINLDGDNFIDEFRKNIDYAIINFKNNFILHLAVLEKDFYDSHKQLKGYEGSFGRICCHKEDFISLGGYNESFLPIAYQDSDLLLRAIAKKMSYINMPIKTKCLKNNKSITYKTKNNHQYTWADCKKINQLISNYNISNNRLIAPNIIKNFKCYFNLQSTPERITYNNTSEIVSDWQIIEQTEQTEQLEMQNIIEFYNSNVLDEEFDSKFYQTNYPETINYYQPFCSQNNISEQQRLFHHYILYGKKSGYLKNLKDFIQQNLSVLDMTKIYTGDVDQIYPVFPAYVEQYMLQTQNGKEIAAKSKIGIVSLARNCSKNIIKSIKNIQKIICKDWRMIIYENDSIDNTKNLLQSVEDNRIHTISIDDNSSYLIDRSQTRTNNLARYRNFCIDWVDKNYSDCDYVIVLDLDADLGFSIEGIYNSIGWLSSLDDAGGMGSYSPLLSIENSKIVFVHYDSFAVRMNDWEPITNNKDIHNPWFRNWHPLVGSNPVPIYSCFGGLAVYKTKAFLKGRYDGNLGSEHIAFHKSLRDEGYNMYLNPSSRFFLYTNQ